jgi:hypothetical protein
LEEVNGIDTESAEGSIARTPDVGSAAIESTFGSWLVGGDEAELCGESDAPTPPSECLADPDLRHAIDVCGVEQRDPRIRSAVNQRDSRTIFTYAACIEVGDTDAHAAEAKR